jgi:TRAP-type C4-dicarboxylate transport system permease small subunit
VVDASPEDGAPIEMAPGGVHRVLEAIGAGALLLAMATDAIAVIGRHAGFSFLGAIELFQVFAVVATSAAIVLTTLSKRHAAVHILTEYVAPPRKLWLDRAGLAAGALSFALLCAGSLWVAGDLWNTHEMTELLGIPLRWFRLVWIVSAGTVTVLFLSSLVRSFQR